MPTYGVSGRWLLISVRMNEGRNLEESVRTGNVMSVRNLLHEGALPQNVGKSSLLHMASRDGDSRMITCLLTDTVLFGQNLNQLAPDTDCTPLMCACQSGNGDAVKTLLDLKADLNLISYHSGNTPLHHAVQGGWLKAAEVLVAYGADIARANKAGLSPIALCCQEWGEDPMHRILTTTDRVNLKRDQLCAQAHLEPTPPVRPAKAKSSFNRK